MTFYFDPQTKQVWGVDQGPDSDQMSVDEDTGPAGASGSNTRTLQEGRHEEGDLRDSDIEMAAQIARTVSLRPIAHRLRMTDVKYFQPDNPSTYEHPLAQATTSRFRRSAGPSHITTSYSRAALRPVSQSQPTPQPVQNDAASVPGTSTPHVPTTVTPANDQPEPSGSQQEHHPDSGDCQPRLSAAEKGKRPAVVPSWVPISEEVEEEEQPIEEVIMENATPTPYFAQVSSSSCQWMASN